MDYFREREAKVANDHSFFKYKPRTDQTPTPVLERGSLCGQNATTPRQLFVPGPIIVGAGPSGLAVAACLKRLGIPRLILERSSCIASLWQLNTYDRLRLHLPKKFCELPYFPFPSDFPTYPTKQHFISYLEDYVEQFDLKPVFNREVVSAEFDKKLGLWRVLTCENCGCYNKKGNKNGVVVEYLCRWVIVATGENAEPVVPEIEGVKDFEGKVVHTSRYKSGKDFKEKRVLVVGCGNSGMEVSLDLCNHKALPALVVRDSVHVLPQEMLGTSTFGLSMQLLKWFPIRLVDRFLLLISRMMLGDTTRVGLNRPSIGPLELKNATGKTPVLDMGTIAKIRSGNIKIFPAIKRLVAGGAEFVNGKSEKFDVVILATGYKSNVPYWLKGSGMFSDKDGFPIKPFPNGWKGENGLYAVGFSRRGILGLSVDAKRIAEDIDHTSRSIKEQYVVGCPRPKSCRYGSKKEKKTEVGNF